MHVLMIIIITIDHRLIGSIVIIILLIIVVVIDRIDRIDSIHPIDDDDDDDDYGGDDDDSEIEGSSPPDFRSIDPRKACMR
jgi:hypothetical protein